MVAQKARRWIKRGTCPVAFNMHQDLDAWLSVESSEYGPCEHGQGGFNNCSPEAAANHTVSEGAAVATAILGNEAIHPNGAQLARSRG